MFLRGTLIIKLGIFCLCMVIISCTSTQPNPNENDNFYDLKETPTEKSNDKFHGVGKFNVTTGVQNKSASNKTYTSVFSETIVTGCSVVSWLISEAKWSSWMNALSERVDDEIEKLSELALANHVHYPSQ